MIEFWNRLPLWARCAILATLGLLLGLMVYASWEALIGLLAGLFGLQKATPAPDPNAGVKEAIARREAWEAEQSKAREIEKRQAERHQAKKQEAQQAEARQDQAIEREVQATPPEKLHDTVLDALDDAEKKMDAMKGLLLPVVLALLLSGCALPRGAGDSMPAAALPPSTKPICYSDTESRRLAIALKRCAALPDRCKERCGLALEEERQRCQAGLRSSSATLQLCRAEREAALSRKCPACEKCGSILWPVLVASGVGLVVGVGIGVAIGVMAGK